MDLDLRQKGWGGGTTHWHLHSALWGESGGWKEMAASCPLQSKRCSKEQILPFDWGMGAKIALIRGRLIYSLFKHLTWLLCNKPNQVPDPTVPDPEHLSAKSGRACILAGHSWKAGITPTLHRYPQLPAPLTWDESELGAVSPSAPTETGETREETPRFLTAAVRKSDAPEV